MATSIVVWPRVLWTIIRWRIDLRRWFIHTVLAELAPSVIGNVSHWNAHTILASACVKILYSKYLSHLSFSRSTYAQGGKRRMGVRIWIGFGESGPSFASAPHAFHNQQLLLQPHTVPLSIRPALHFQWIHPIWVFEADDAIAKSPHGSLLLPPIFLPRCCVPQYWGCYRDTKTDLIL